MQSAFLLDVVIGQSSAVLKLFASKDQSLLIRRDAFLVLNFLLDVFDRVTWLSLQGDCLACERLDENLHRHVWRSRCGCFIYLLATYELRVERALLLRLSREFECGRNYCQSGYIRLACCTISIGWIVSAVRFKVDITPLG